MATHLTQELKETLTLILAGGEGGRLKPLTQVRAKPAVPFGGAYRIIDFTLSNCIHSGLRRIYVLTQYQALSLDEHVRFAWNFLPRRLEQFIAVRPPHHRHSAKWYRGTADAIAHNLETLYEERPRNVLILSGDHIYKMDYGTMLRQHASTGAALTIGAVRVPTDEAHHFGILVVDSDNRIIDFQEKPKENPAQIPGQPGWCLASMGIYVFEREELIRRLRDDVDDDGSTHDFGKDIIPRMIQDVPLYAHPFRDESGDEPYWRDVGTIESYYEANMDLCNVEPQFNLYDMNWPTYSLWHNDPPAKTVFAGGDGKRAEVVDSLLCPGVIVSGAEVRNSLLSNRVYVGDHALLDGVIALSGARIGKGARLRRTILEKWIEVPDEERIGFDPDADRERGFTVTPEGITVVPHGYRFA